MRFPIMQSCKSGSRPARRRSARQLTLRSIRLPHAESIPAAIPANPAPQKRDADYIFYELTRSICPKS